MYIQWIKSGAVQPPTVQFTVRLLEERFIPKNQQNYAVKFATLESEKVWFICQTVKNDH